MENGRKIAITIGVMAVAAVGIWYIVKNTKNTLKELDQRDKDNETIRQASLSTDEKEKEKEGGNEEEEEDLNTNLPKSIFEELKHDSDFPIEAIDARKILAGRSRNIVHIQQRSYQKFNRATRKKEIVDVVDFIFELPRRRNKTYPTVGEFISQIRGRYDRDLDRVLEDDSFQGRMREIVDNPENNGNLKISGTAFDSSRFESYLLLSYEEYDEEDDKWYEKSVLYPVDNRTLELEQKEGDEEDDEIDIVTKVNRRYDDKRVLTDEDKYQLTAKDDDKERNILIEDAFYAVRVSFKVRNNSSIAGISTPSAAKIIKEIYNKLEISNYNGDLYQYDSFLMYDPTIDTTECYGFDENGETEQVSPIWE